MHGQYELQPESKLRNLSPWLLPLELNNNGPDQPDLPPVLPCFQLRQVFNYKHLLLHQLPPRIIPQRNYMFRLPIRLRLVSQPGPVHLLR